MDFFYEHFVRPILSNGWFNPINSIAYGLILVLAVYIVFKMLKKMNIHVDKYLLYSIIPFILWAAGTRVLHDAAYAGVLTGDIGDFYALPIFPTPGSYMITFLVAIVTLLISLLIQKYSKVPYWKTMLSVGIVLNIINFALLPIINFIPMFMILGLTTIWAGIFIALHKISLKTKIKAFKDIFTIENVGLLTAHMHDASSTFVAMTFFGYLEQHPLPRTLIEMTNPGAMFVLKLVVMIPVLYAIDKYAEEGQFKMFLKIVILILGLAPGLRDMMRLMVAV